MSRCARSFWYRAGSRASQLGRRRRNGGQTTRAVRPLKAPSGFAKTGECASPRGRARIHHAECGPCPAGDSRRSTRGGRGLPAGLRAHHTTLRIIPYGASAVNVVLSTGAEGPLSGLRAVFRGFPGVFGPFLRIFRDFRGSFCPETGSFVGSEGSFFFADFWDFCCVIL